MSLVTSETAYRHALAAYHSHQRDEFLSFLWSRPAHESFTPERNGCPPRLEKSTEIINPLTGRRLGSDPSLPTPPGRDWIRTRAREQVRMRRQGAAAEGRPCAVMMERSGHVFQGELPVLRQDQDLHSREYLRTYSTPVRPTTQRRGTSSSSFGIRGRVGSGSGSTAGDLDINGLRIDRRREPRQRSFHCSRRRDASRETSGSEIESDDEDDPPSLSEHSSRSSVAVASPTAPSDEPLVSHAPRYSIDEAEGLPAILKPVASNQPILSAFGTLHPIRPTQQRTTSTTTLGPQTASSEASFAALAPSPLFISGGGTEADLREFPGFAGGGKDVVRERYLVPDPQAQRVASMARLPAAGYGQG